MVPIDWALLVVIGLLFFVVPGRPVPWARARRAGERYFTAKVQKAYAQKVKILAKAAGARKIDGAVSVTIEAYWTWPKAQQRKLDPLERGWYLARPDMDNIQKLVLDALEGVCFKNDSQVCEVIARKFYCRQGEDARVEVRVVEV